MTQCSLVSNNDCSQISWVRGGGDKPGDFLVGLTLIPSSFDRRFVLSECTVRTDTACHTRASPLGLFFQGQTNTE